MPPAPSVVVSGYEELLEVAEAILFSHSVALPPTVLDKYRMLQREVKDRIHSASISAESATDFGSTAPSLRSPLQAGESERNVILAEKLAQSKKKTAELRAQVASLESQLHQMTLRVQQLHAMHADSAKELVAQTKHACESANQRVLAELETKLAHEAGLARKNAADALESERAFHASIVRKIEAMEVMFPAEYAGLRASQESLADHMAQGGNPLLAAMSPGSRSIHNERGHDGSNPIGMTRLHLNSFFESTRAALNHSKHYRRDLSEALLEVKDLRARVSIEEEARFAMDKAARNVVARVDELQQEIVRAASTSGSDSISPPRSAVVRQRDEIVAGVLEVERRMKSSEQRERLRLPAAATAASASSSALPSFRAATVELDAALSPRSAAGRRVSVERDAESEAEGNHSERQQQRDERTH